MADAKNIKVTYFDITGRAEIIRLVLTLGGKDFEDNRIKGEQWQELKPKTPYGQLPVVEIDGKMYGQSMAIANYFAREFGCYGKTNMEKFQIEQVELLGEDLIKEFAKSFGEKDEAKKAEILKHVKTECGPKFLGFFEGFLKENNTGYIAGKSLTLGDLIVFDICTGFLKDSVADSIPKFPMVQKLVETVGSNDRIKAYMAKRK